MGSSSTEDTAGESPFFLRDPGALWLGRSGHLWVADSGHGRVLKVASDGRVLASFGAPPGADDALAEPDFDEAIALSGLRLSAPRGLALAADERVLFVADGGSRCIWRVDVRAASARLMASPPGRSAASHDGRAVGAQFSARGAMVSEARALALDEDADALYLAMADCRQIWRLDISAGQMVVLAGDSHGGAAGRESPGPAHADAQADGPLHRATFAHPCGVVLAPDRKRLYIADRGSGAVRIVHLSDDTTTTLISAEDGLSGCTDVAIGPGGFVVVDADHDVLWGVNPRHRTLTRLWGGPGQLSRPSAVAFDRDNHSYVVADAGNHRLVRLMRDMSGATEMRLHTGGADSR